MTYSRTIWVNDEAPAISAGNLNNIEVGIVTNALTVSLKDYGAVGDGSTNDTVAVQAAIDAAPAGSRIVGEAGKTYSVGNLTITDKTGVIFDGQGAKLLLRATGARAGVELVGTCTDVEVCNWRITGNGLTADSHAGVYCESGADAFCNHSPQ